MNSSIKDLEIWTNDTFPILSFDNPQKKPVILKYGYQGFTSVDRLCDDIQNLKEKLEEQETFTEIKFVSVSLTLREKSLTKEIVQILFKQFDYHNEIYIKSDFKR